MQEVDGFDAFCAASQQRVHHALYAFTGDVSETQDLVQEAYARCWQRWAKVGGYPDPEGWVRTSRTGAGASVDNVVLVDALRRISPTQRIGHNRHLLVWRPNFSNASVPQQSSPQSMASAPSG